MTRRQMTRRLGLAVAGAVVTAGCAPARPRRIAFEAGPFMQAVWDLDKGAQAHYQSTVWMVALAGAAVKAQRLKLPDGVNLDSYLAEARSLKKVWDGAVKTVTMTVATAQDDALFSTDTLKSFAEAIAPMAEMVVRVLPLLSAIAL